MPALVANPGPVLSPTINQIDITMKQFGSRLKVPATLPGYAQAQPDYKFAAMAR